MKFSYNWLQSFFDKKLPKPEKLAEILTMHSFEVEGIEKKGNDFVLDVDVLPNRAGDCFSHLGIAKECGALLNYKLQTSNYKPQMTSSKLQTKDFILVEVRDKKTCPRYTVKVITDIKVDSSPKWLEDRLKTCGLKPINNIVDIANYVMLEMGQPLHVFDFNKIKSKKIIIRRAKKGEKITTLDEKDYILNKDILIIADSEKPLAIAGIKGGKEAGIDKNTKIIVLESANFSPGVIRKGSRKLKLRTDASIRFEHGLDSNLSEVAINRAVFLIEKLAGGKIAKGNIDLYSKKTFPKIISLDINQIERLLGIKVKNKDIKKILIALGFKIKNSRGHKLKVEVPTKRLDILQPVDLIEEVGRIIGYENIPSEFPKTVITPSQRNISLFWEEKIKNIFRPFGFFEIYNYTFISKEQSDSFNYSAVELIEVESPVSIEQKYLRPSLIPNLLKNIQKNQKNFNEIKIFELGKIFKNLKTTKEKKQFSGLVTGELFYELKGIIDLLLNKLRISNIQYNTYEPVLKESKLNIWHSKKSAEIKAGNEKIGFLGEISPKILAQMKINTKVLAFDLDFEKLVKLSSEEKIYQPIFRYPAANRDLAILVPLQVKVVEVLNKIQLAGGNLVKDVDLFDIYEGENIPFGKKNFAFHIIYQARNRTLSFKEIDKIHQKIIKALEQNKTWKVRK